MLIAVCSLKSSPGVTTLAVALGARWPGPEVPIVVEADPAGGDLLTRFRLSAELTLVRPGRLNSRPRQRQRGPAGPPRSVPSRWAPGAAWAGRSGASPRSTGLVGDRPVVALAPRRGSGGHRRHRRLRSGGPELCDVVDHPQCGRDVAPCKAARRRARPRCAQAPGCSAMVTTTLLRPCGSRPPCRLGGAGAAHPGHGAHPSRREGRGCAVRPRRKPERAEQVRARAGSGQARSSDSRASLSVLSARRSGRSQVVPLSTSLRSGSLLQDGAVS